MNNYILSIDQGTTSSRAIIFDDSGEIVEVAQQEFAQHYPQNGWVEHDPEQIWSTTLTVAQQVIGSAGVPISTIGICNQRETTLVWDKTTGETIYNAIVWQDRRTCEFCNEIRTEQNLTLIKEKTGLLIDPYFSATKVRWILENVEGARERAENGDLLFGTVDSYLIWKMTGGQQHVTDATNASRTMLFNIHTQQWDDELLSLFSIPKSMLPDVLDSADNFGTTSESIFGYSIPINGVAGDQQAALFGQNCFEKGMAKSTFGTGGFLMVNTGGQVYQSKNQLLSTVAYRLKGQTTYALEGSIFIAGAAVNWLRDGIKIIDTPEQSSVLADEISYDHGVYLVPAFTGLGAPHWDAEARGGLLGLTRASGISEIVSATLQSIGYQARDLQRCIIEDGIDIKFLRVDGGVAQDDWTMGFLADILQLEVKRPKTVETSALGVALLAGLASGIYASTDEINQGYVTAKTFAPQISLVQRDKLYQKWLKAVESVRQFQ
ncbi:carbohydrate kinase [Catenovulum agarivorans DS-2]|uniref:Glycerol kinase n=1 Tax=Catenovulum agarivorans DS-2 TaxID=1328313 RepID=W7QQP4_9ALTE|nr:glycerol kinase GlpK [Catenovulum agarivorans]EWH10203.1 carbohydrate kinase [Catenovulum agarivorans DS-2]